MQTLSRDTKDHQVLTDELPIWKTDSSLDRQQLLFDDLIKSRPNLADHETAKIYLDTLANGRYQHEIFDGDGVHRFSSPDKISCSKLVQDPLLNIEGFLLERKEGYF